MEVLGNIFIDRLLLTAFVQNTLSQIYSHCIKSCIFWYIMEIAFVFEENIFKAFFYLWLFYPKTTNFDNSGMIDSRKLSDSSMNNIFNRLSVGLQHALSFKWPDFGLKCFFAITPKGQSFKCKTVVWNISISETGRNLYSLLRLADGN